jgi:hypothetical protein
MTQGFLSSKNNTSQSGRTQSMTLRKYDFEKNLKHKCSIQVELCHVMFMCLSLSFTHWSVK